MTRPMLHLFVVGFGRPDLLRQQKRLLSTYLMDPFTVTVLDNTIDPYGQADMEVACDELGIGYMRVVSEKHEHPDALNRGATIARERGLDFFGFLDHDVMPCRETTILDKLASAGFLGLGQTYSPRVGRTLRYLWPGWIFFTRLWLGGRAPDFQGIRGEFRFDDGDAGSMLHSLFTEDDWLSQVHVAHSYGTIRPDDGHGLQSFGYERIADAWIHFTNASRWKSVPNPDERDHLLREMLEAL